MDKKYQHDTSFPYICRLIRRCPPSDVGFSILLKKTDIDQIAVKEQKEYFTRYTIQRIVKQEINIWTWVEEGWYENQDGIIDLIFQYGTNEMQNVVMTHLFMNFSEVIYAPMDYWFMRLSEECYNYIDYSHLIRFSVDKKEIHKIDPRIIQYIKNKKQPTPCEDHKYPSFYKHHKEQLVFVDNHGGLVSIPIYQEYLLSSRVIQTLLSKNGFKEKDGIKDGRIVLEIPDLFRDQKQIVCEWVQFCYVRTIENHLTVKDVLELYHLSGYLMDDQCRKACREWLETTYLKNFETHKKKDCGLTITEEDCLLCSFWMDGHVSGLYNNV